jgi:predicted short-subunit dehydrogenase-like oxidoreductase (DUF2520 family)
VKIGLIGDAPAGPILLKAWAGAGHELIGVFVESPEAIERIELLLPDVPIAPMAAVAEEAEVLVFAVPYSDIEITCQGLTDLGLFGPRKILLHLSPHHGIEVLADAARLGAIPIAMHPLMHFSGTSMDIHVLQNATVIVTAAEPFGPIAQALALELGAEPIELTQDQRAAFAEAFDVASGFSSLVVQQAMGILEQAGVSSPARLIGPVVRSEIDRTLAQPVRPIDPEDAK